ncbi:hypothetical protein [Geminocystis herdmanii]|uniref:hypothetical protein n=1 Tax=Geminocystis herdmanii TaxID=669359 RepID=UPI00034D25FD|nr:hypothetical protein [Geminocystis herdmanii]
MKKIAKKILTFIRAVLARLIYLILGRSSIVQEVKTLKRQVEDLTREKEILDSEIKVLSDNFAELDAMRKNLQNDIYSLEKNKDDLQTKVKEEEGILLNLQQQIQETTQTKDTQEILVAKLNEKISELENIYNSLKVQNNSLNNEANELKNQLKLIILAINEEQKKREILEAEIINQNAILDVKHREIDAINSSIELKIRELENINQDINERTKQGEELTKIVDNNQEKSEQLLLKIREKKVILQQLEIEIDSYTKNKEQLIREIDIDFTNKKQLETDINSDIENKEKLIREIDIYLEDREQIKRDINDSNENKEQLKKEIDTYIENKQNLHQEISSLEAKKQALEFLIQKLDKQITEKKEQDFEVETVIKPSTDDDYKQRRDYLSILWLRDIFPCWLDKNKPEGERYLGNINISREFSEMLLDSIEFHLKGFESINREALDNYFKGKDWTNNNWINTFTFALSEYAYYYRNDRAAPLRDRFWQGFCHRISINHSLTVENTLREIVRDGIQQLGLIEAEEGYEYVSTLKLQHRFRENPPLITVKPAVKEVVTDEIKLFLDIEDSGDILLMLPSQELWQPSWEELRGSEVSIPQQGWRGVIPETGNLTIPELSTPIREIAEEWCWQLITNDGEILSHWRCVGIEKNFPFLMFDYWTADRIPLLDNLLNKEEIICFIPSDVDLSYSEEIELIEDGIPSSISGWEGIQLALTGKKGQLIIKTIQETRTIHWYQTNPEETETIAKPQLRGIKLKEKEDIYLEIPSLWYPPLSHAETVDISVNNLKNHQFYSKKIELNSNSQWQEIPLREWINSKGEYSLNIQTEGNNYSWSPKFKLSSSIEISDKFTSYLDIEIDNKFIPELPLKVDSAEEFWTKQITLNNLWTLEIITFCLDNGIDNIEKILQADSSGKVSFSLATLRDVLPEYNYYFLSYKRQGDTLHKLIEINKENTIADEFKGDKSRNNKQESSPITYSISIANKNKRDILFQEFNQQIKAKNLSQNSFKLDNDSTIKELILITLEDNKYLPILQEILAELETNPRLRIKLNLTLWGHKRR